ncbi:MAG: RHS repeat-associated core domain-containing protein [Planctomycetaceae bacterium]
MRHPDAPWHPTTYAYNADQLRVSREDSVETRKYVYDGTNVLLETADAVTDAVYTLNPQAYGHVLSQHRDETSFYHYDGVQDTRSLTDSTETETDSYTFDPWGRETSSTGTTDNPFTYKGQAGYYKDTALDPSEAAYILHHRILDAVGRFTSPDPAEDDLNLYRYVRNNPLNEVDPSGLQETRKYRLVRSDGSIEVREMSPSVAENLARGDLYLSVEPVDGGAAGTSTGSACRTRRTSAPYLGNPRAAEDAEQQRRDAAAPKPFALRRAPNRPRTDSALAPSLNNILAQGDLSISMTLRTRAATQTPSERARSIREPPR